MIRPTSAGGGSLSQSAVNEGAGGRSEMCAILAAALIAVTVLVVTPRFRNLPEAVRAALIIHAVSHLWKVAAMRRVYAVRRIEFALGLATTDRRRHHRQREPAARHGPRALPG